MYIQTELKLINPDSNEWDDIIALLEKAQIRLDDAIDYTFGYYEEDKLIGTASVQENVIKSIAIDMKLRGSNALARMLDDIISDIYDKGYKNIFLFTKSDAVNSFSNIGFYEVDRIEININNSTESVVLMEKNPEGLKGYLKLLNNFKVNTGTNGAIVMNGNPFTFGHLYLIETAAKHCDFLYVFVVRADKSTFPYDVRFDLISQGTVHLNNVYVISGGDYIISSATFPNYFLKSKSTATAFQAALDVKIFADYIASTLSIKKRFVGTEPYCETTNSYNEKLKELLPRYDIELVEIERLESLQGAISASLVRQLILSQDYVLLEKLVPKTTLDYIKSPNFKPIRQKLKRSNSRH